MLPEDLLAIPGDLKNKIDPVRNRFWSGGVSNPLEVIEQITYLLFMRRLDDLRTTAEQKAQFTGTGVIVPDGVLSGCSTAHRTLRRILVEEEQLEAVVKLPSGVFKPDAGVSTAIRFFRRTGGTGGTENMWSYDVEADGLSLDDKRQELLPAAELGPAPTEEHHRDPLEIIADLEKLDEHFHRHAPGFIAEDGLRPSTAVLLPQSALLSSRAPIGLLAINTRPKEISMGTIERFGIPLPPLGEQRRVSPLSVHAQASSSRRKTDGS